jgi:hypothetical protein
MLFLNKYLFINCKNILWTILFLDPYNILEQTPFNRIGSTELGIDYVMILLSWEWTLQRRPIPCRVIGKLHHTSPGRKVLEKELDLKVCFLPHLNSVFDIT